MSQQLTRATLLCAGSDGTISLGRRTIRTCSCKEEESGGCSSRELLAEDLHQDTSVLRFLTNLPLSAFPLSLPLVQRYP